MKLMNVTVPAGQSIEYAVPPSTFFYLHALGTAGAISVKLFGKSGDLIANLPLVLKGVRYRTSDAAEPFRSVTIKNVTQASATCAFYVGLDEIIPPVTVTGGGGGTTSEVSADFARGLSLPVQCRARPDHDRHRRKGSAPSGRHRLGLGRQSERWHRDYERYRCGCGDDLRSGQGAGGE